MSTHLRVVVAVAEAVFDEQPGDWCRNEDRWDDRFIVAFTVAADDGIDDDDDDGDGDVDETRDPPGSDWHLCTKSRAREMHLDVIRL